MKSSFAILICWLLQVQHSPAESLFEKADLSVSTPLGRYEVYHPRELEDVVIRTFEILPGKGERYRLNLAFSHQETVEKSAIEFETLDLPARVTATLIDLNEGGKNNGSPQIKITLTQGEKVQYRRVSFPPGYGLKSQQLNPPKLHMKWTLAFMHITGGEPNPVDFEFFIEKMK